MGSKQEKTRVYIVVFSKIYETAQIYFFSNRMGIMGCLLGLAVFPATAVSLAPCPRTAIIRGSVTVCQEWLERSVIAVLMAFTHSRMVAAHVSSNP